MPSHFEAARGAYVMRDFKPGAPRGGTVFVQGTTTTANLVKVLPQLDERGPQRARSWRASARSCSRMQDEAYRERIRVAEAIAGTAWPSPTARAS